MPLPAPVRTADHRDGTPGMRGFTLMELLVVMAILALLVAILLPAVQQVREAARRTECRNHLHQLAVAVHNYESTHRRFPPSYGIVPGVTTTVGGQWSVLARVLPFVEEANLARLIDWNLAYSAQLSVATTRIAMYLCPSEVHDHVRINPATGRPRDYPANYAVNFGTWKVFDLRDGSGGDGAFHPNSAFTTAHFSDGTSPTLLAAEVKAFTPYVRNTADPGPAPPASPAFAGGLTGDGCCIGPTVQQNTGHTEWADGLCHQSGFTTTFVPNTRIPYTVGGVEYDIDYVSWREGTSATQPTYAALPARSYHAGLVHAAFMDASIRVISENIGREVWRGAGTRSGGEIPGRF